MFNEEQKIVARIAPALQRVLIVDPQTAAARLLAEQLRNLFPCQIWIASSKAKTVELLSAALPQVVFLELAGGDWDGAELTRWLRRSDLACRKAPVIITSGAPTAAILKTCRDAGVHEFLCKPYAGKDVLRRLDAVTRPRPWIEAVEYVGPDRRRFNSAAYAGERKRGADKGEAADAARLRQAFKILAAATRAMASDPVQSLRSMKAQAADLHALAVALDDKRLATAAGDFGHLLKGVPAITVENAPAVMARAAALLLMAPADTRREAA